MYYARDCRFLLPQVRIDEQAGGTHLQFRRGGSHLAGAVRQLLWRPFPPPQSDGRRGLPAGAGHSPLPPPSHHHRPLLLQPGSAPFRLLTYTSCWLVRLFACLPTPLAASVRLFACLPTPLAGLLSSSSAYLHLLLPLFGSSSAYLHLLLAC